jgi:hypothetical protein
MLTDPNVDSPANIDAAVSCYADRCEGLPIQCHKCVLVLAFTMYHLGSRSSSRQKMFRENPKEFRKTVSKCVERSQEMAS